MARMEPILNSEAMHRIAQLVENNPRDKLLFRLNFYLGLRVGDYVRLQVKDFMQGGALRDRLEIKEQKTGKMKSVKLGPTVKSLLRWYFSLFPDLAFDSYLFPPQDIVAKRLRGLPASNVHISRIQAYRLMRDWCRKVGLKGHFGTHSWRKTLGWTIYNASKDIELVRRVLNHSSALISQAYLGVADLQVDEAVEKVSIAF